MYGLLPDYGSRRAENALWLLDQHGTDLYQLACALSRNDRFASSTLVVDTLASNADPLLPIDNRHLRLAVELFRAWKLQDAPTPPVKAAGPSDAHAQDPMDELTDDEISALALCRFGHHTFRQAASVMNADPNLVAGWLHSALTTLGDRRSP